MVYQLRECPFCGGTASLGYVIEIEKDTEQSRYMVSVGCRECGSQGKAFNSGDINPGDNELSHWDNIACQRAVVHWNQRESNTRFNTVKYIKRGKRVNAE